MTTRPSITGKYERIWDLLDERARRLLAANDAITLGYGGISQVHRGCGLSRKTIHSGINEISDGSAIPPGRIRRLGAGRKLATVRDPQLVRQLESLVEPLSRGDPESPLRWTCKSTRLLAGELKAKQHDVSHETVARLLHGLNYSLQSNRKMEEGEDHPDRDAQFRHINAAVKRALKDQSPVISVDTKKKELVGNYENKGRLWHPAKSAVKVNGHDFPSPLIPRAYPYGIYDIGRNTGFVNVGTDRDTGAFAVASIRGWWRHEGKGLYPTAKSLLITADGGGSNGVRLRLWKRELQRFSDESGLIVSVCHFPPGTSKWNKVEHRLFSFISSNWRGEPLKDYETVVQLIANTTTAKGLAVKCRLDRRKYPVGQRIPDADMAQINLQRCKFHGEWNYTISPSKQLKS